LIHLVPKFIAGFRGRHGNGHDNGRIAGWPPCVEATGEGPDILGASFAETSGLGPSGGAFGWVNASNSRAMPGRMASNYGWDKTNLFDFVQPSHLIPDETGTVVA